MDVLRRQSVSHNGRLLAEAAGVDRQLRPFISMKFHRDKAVVCNLFSTFRCPYDQELLRHTDQINMTEWAMLSVDGVLYSFA